MLLLIQVPAWTAVQTSTMSQPLDNKTALKVKFPKVFEGLGKLNAYQQKLHQDDSVQPVAQPLRQIPFSRRQKVTAKLKQLEGLDVIEKSMFPLAGSIHLWS